MLETSRVTAEQVEAGGLLGRRELQSGIHLRIPHVVGDEVDVVQRFVLVADEGDTLEAPIDFHCRRTMAVVAPHETRVHDHLSRPLAAFVDEWIAGYRRQWPGQVIMDASFVRRYYRHRPAAVEINRHLEGVTFVGYKDEALNDIYLITNNVWNTQVYSGLEFTAAKQTAGLNLLGGYTRGFQHLAGTWVPGDPASLIQPEAFANDKGIGSIRGNEVN